MIARRCRKFAWQGRLQWHDGRGWSWFAYRCKEVALMVLDRRTA